MEYPEVAIVDKGKADPMTNRARWNKDTTYAFGLHKCLIRIFGIWPLDDQGLFSTLRVSIVIIIEITLPIIFASQWIKKGNCGSITDLVDALTIMAACLMAVMKIILPWIYRKRISSIITSAIQDWADGGDEKSRNIMLRYAYIGRLVFIVQMFGRYMTIPSLLISRPPNWVDIEDFADESVIPRNIPIGPNCWISPLSLSGYCFYYSFVCTNMFILVTTYLCGDVFAFSLAMHLCGQFEILYTSFDDVNGDETPSIHRIKVVKFAKRHDLLLKLADDFEAVFHMLIFFELGANTFIICISEIILLWACRVGDTQIISAMVIRIYLIYIQIFMYSYIGENLSTQARKLQEAIYNSPWYKMKPIIVKDIKFIMMRNNQLFHLTAGKICNMDYENFKIIVKSMFSYFSILRLMFNQ